MPPPRHLEHAGGLCQRRSCSAMQHLSIRIWICMHACMCVPACLPACLLQVLIDVAFKQFLVMPEWMEARLVTRLATRTPRLLPGLQTQCLPGCRPHVSQATDPTPPRLQTPRLPGCRPRVPQARHFEACVTHRLFSAEPDSFVGTHADLEGRTAPRVDNWSLHTAAASIAYGCSLYCIRLQPLLHTPAASIVYGRALDCNGCSLLHAWLRRGEGATLGRDHSLPLHLLGPTRLAPGGAAPSLGTRMPCHPAPDGRKGTGHQALLALRIVAD